MSRANSKNLIFWLILLLAHIAVMTALYLKFGLNTINESDKYLTSAEAIVNGALSKGLEYQLFYSGYIFYLAFFLLLKIPVTVIFIVTYLLSVFSFFNFYFFVKYFFGKITAQIWIALMLLSPLILFWQFHLYSEVFFISLSLLFISLLFRKKYLMSTALAILLILTRPSGIFTVTAITAVFLLNKNAFSKKLILASLFSFLTVIHAVVIFFVPMHYRGVCIDVASGSVYCGFPMLYLPNVPEADHTLAFCYSHIISDHGTKVFVALFLKKMFSFFNLTRPWYTGFHNIFNALHYAFYLLAILGFYFSRYMPQNAFFRGLLLIILMNALLVALFFNEWSERYTVQVFPYIFLISAFALQRFYNKVSGKIAV
jgi:hypothetical protein